MLRGLSDLALFAPALHRLTAQVVLLLLDSAHLVGHVQNADAPSLNFTATFGQNQPVAQPYCPAASLASSVLNTIYLLAVKKPIIGLLSLQ